MNLMDKYRARLGDMRGRTPNSGPPVDELLDTPQAKLKEPLLRKQADFEAMFNQALEEINLNYEPGTIQFIKTTHPDLWKRIVETENKITGTWLSGNTEDFKAALDEWRKFNLQAIGIFRERSVQKTLFDVV